MINRTLLPTARKDLTESAGGVARDWTKSSSVHKKVVAKAIQEPSICSSAPPPHQSRWHNNLTRYLAIDINSTTTQSRFTSAISRTAIDNSSDSTCVTDTKNGTRQRAQRSVGGIRYLPVMFHLALTAVTPFHLARSLPRRIGREAPSPDRRCTRTRISRMICGALSRQPQTHRRYSLIPTEDCIPMAQTTCAPMPHTDMYRASSSTTITLRTSRSILPCRPVRLHMLSCPRPLNQDSRATRLALLSRHIRTPARTISLRPSVYHRQTSNERQPRRTSPMKAVRGMCHNMAWRSIFRGHNSLLMKCSCWIT